MTDDLERSLRTQLEAAASQVDPDPDGADLLHRVRRQHRRRQQVLGGALAIAVVGGPLAGGLFERANRPDATTVASGGAATDGEDSANRGGPLSAPASYGAPSADASQELSIDRDAIWNYEPEPYRSLGSVIVDGVTFRLFTEDHPREAYGDGEWTPPAECMPEGSLIAQASNDTFVASLYAERWATGTPTVAFEQFGRQEGDPRWLLVGRVAGASDIVFPDGSVGAVATLGDWLVATAPIDPDFTPDYENETGLQATIDGEAVSQWRTFDPDFDWRTCEPPPPSLPEPGEQPADPEQARAAIRSAYAAVYDSDSGMSPEDRAALVEIEDMAIEAYRYIAENETAIDEMGTGATVGDIVFVAPDQAVLYYDLLVDGQALYNERIGQATLVDGTWRVSAQTYCSDVSMVGAPCWEYLEREMAATEGRSEPSSEPPAPEALDAEG